MTKLIQWNFSFSAGHPAQRVEIAKAAKKGASARQGARGRRQASTPAAAAATAIVNGQANDPIGNPASLPIMSAITMSDSPTPGAKSQDRRRPIFSRQAANKARPTKAQKPNRRRVNPKDSMSR